MNWMDVYRRKVVTADEAVRAILSHQRVFLTGNCSVPQKLVAALVEQAPDLTDVEIVQVLTDRQTPITRHPKWAATSG